MNKDKTPYKILHILKDGQFHSGEDLGATLSMTRSAIWKGVKQLITHYGLDIQSISGRGYRIEGGLDLLNKEKILHDITIDTQQQLHITLLDQISSTNDYLLETINSSPCCDVPYHVAIAEQQTKGRGRRGDTWNSPYGHNIYFSFAWCCHKDPLELSGLSLAAAVAIVRTLKKLGINDINVKWPNDIYYHHKKLAGVLIDLVAQSHNRTQIVIGVGINTYLSYHAAKMIKQPWTCLRDILGTSVDRNRLIALLTQEMILMLEQFSTQNLAPFIDEWNQHDCFTGKKVVLANADTKIYGIMQGITEHGKLLLKDEHQHTKKYISGELSLRKAT